MASRTTDTTLFGERCTLRDIRPLLMKYMREMDKSRQRAIMLWGPPGVGKSSIVKQVAEELKQEFLRYGLPTTDYNQICGVPWRDEEHQRYIRKPLLQIPSEGQGVYVLDDFTGAPDAVQKIALDLVLERRLLEERLGDGWLLVFCANDIGGVYPLHVPSANRMTHYYVLADYDIWRKWALGPGKIRSEIIGYLDSERDDIYVEPVNQEKAFRSPRSWEAVSRQIDINFGAEDSDSARMLDARDRTLRLVVGGNVGAAGAGKFLAFVQTYRTVDIELALKGKHPPFKGKSGADRQALEFALMSQARAWWNRGKTKTKDRATGLVNVLNMISPQFQAVLIQDLIATDPRKMSDVYKVMSTDKELAGSTRAIYDTLSAIMTGDVA